MNALQTNYTISISATHPTTAKCKLNVHVRLHMYANSTWLNCTTQNDEPCVDGELVQSEMNALCTFGGHGMGGGDTPANYTVSLMQI